VCKCYRIGSPFISEDPDCPIHGRSPDTKAYQEYLESKDSSAIPCNYAAVVADMLEYLSEESISTSEEAKWTDRQNMQLEGAFARKHIKKLASLVSKHSNGLIN
jgi:hypothetical protein